MDKRDIAIAALGVVADWRPIHAWAEHQRRQVLESLATADAMNPGEVARLQGRAAELKNLSKLHDTILTASESPP